MNTSLLSGSAKEVSQDELKGLHTRRSFLLYDGDEITVKNGDTIACAPLTINNEPVVKDGKPVMVYSVECTIRHKSQTEAVDRLIPIGTFTKRPAEDPSAYFAKSELLTSLGQCADDFERFQVLKSVGKFVVNGFHDGKATDWNATPVDGHLPLKSAKFAILQKA